jgi:hypothetical protein
LFCLPGILSAVDRWNGNRVRASTCANRGTARHTKLFPRSRIGRAAYLRVTSPAISSSNSSLSLLFLNAFPVPQWWIRLASMKMAKVTRGPLLPKRPQTCPLCLQSATLSSSTLDHLLWPRSLDNCLLHNIGFDATMLVLRRDCSVQRKSRFICNKWIHF